VRTPDPLAAELLARESAEPAADRAARLANLRWLTVLRLWASMDRAGITDDGERMRFIGERLWPGLAPATLGQLVVAARERAFDGATLVRPARARDIVGERLEALMRERGYDVTARDDAETGH
jgi:hypothetical protein